MSIHNPFVKAPMSSQAVKAIFIGCMIAVTVPACSQPETETDIVEPSVQMFDSTREEAQTREAERLRNARRGALENPSWVKIQTLPAEWGGLYAKNCVMAGPEDIRFFQYRDAEDLRHYYFNYIVFPKNTGHAPEATLVIIDYDVWQNQDWPAHYLLYGVQSYTQFEIRDGVAYGLHQTLDDSPWDAFEHIETEYRVTDHTRWAADLSNTEDYGSEPPCDTALAGPWQDISFVHSDSGQAYKLLDVMK